MASRWDNLAHELGAALLLDEEEFEEVKGRRTGDEGEELLTRINEEWDQRTLKKGLTRFYAAHLPRFMEAYSELLRRFGPKMKNHPWSSFVGGLVGSHPLFTRWARDMENGPMFTRALVEWYLPLSFPMDFSRRTIPLETFESLSALGDFILTLLNTIVSLPPPPSPSTQAPSFSKDLRQQFLIRLLEHSDAVETYQSYRIVRDTTQAQRDSYDRVFRYLPQVERYANAETYEKWREVLKEGGGYVRWYECENVLKKPCADVEEVDMPACARCNAVRYCSKAHQTDHWETHQPNCKKPKW